MTRTLPPVLDSSAVTVGSGLRAACDRLSPGMRAVVGYHLGWLDADGKPADLEGGKSVRAALALLSARAAGGDAADGLPGAVAVELVHTFSLLHDDIMDGDAERHHRPAAWAVFGRARAILAGDAVLALAFQVLLDSGSAHRAAALESLSDATARLIDGQAAGPRPRGAHRRHARAVHAHVRRQDRGAARVRGVDRGGAGWAPAATSSSRCARSAATSGSRSRRSTTCSGSGATRP